MKTSTILLILAIVLPSIALIVMYYIARHQPCTPSCDNKTCGDSDGCGNICKKCPPGNSCDGKICTSVIQPPDPTNVKGICYFDIDGTLTTAVGDRDEIINQCLDNNFAVGIITASGRTVEDICSGDKAGGRQNAENWMSNILCKQFADNNAKMYNSTSLVAGKPAPFPDNYPNTSSPGVKKGFDMVYGRDSFYSDIPNKCVVLFDDDPTFISGVKQYKSDLETQCANKSCGGDVLTKDIVLNKVKSMIKNGCA